MCFCRLICLCVCHKKKNSDSLVEQEEGVWKRHDNAFHRKNWAITRAKGKREKRRKMKAPFCGCTLDIPSAPPSVQLCISTHMMPRYYAKSMATENARRKTRLMYPPTCSSSSCFHSSRIFKWASHFVFINAHRLVGEQCWFHRNINNTIDTASSHHLLGCASTWLISRAIRWWRPLFHVMDVKR